VRTTGKTECGKKEQLEAVEIHVPLKHEISRAGGGLARWNTVNRLSMTIEINGRRTKS
jgi:hypothetical protein